MYLFRTLCKRGMLSKLVRDSLSEFLRSANILRGLSLEDDDTHVFSRASRGPAWFIAATNAVTDEERRMCARGLGECGSEKVFRTNLQAVQALWKEVDEAGTGPVDWREFLSKEGFSLVFL